MLAVWHMNRGQDGGRETIWKVIVAALGRRGRRSRGVDHAVFLVRTLGKCLTKPGGKKEDFFSKSKAAPKLLLFWSYIPAKLNNSFAS